MACTLRDQAGSKKRRERSKRAKKLDPVSLSLNAYARDRSIMRIATTRSSSRCRRSSRRMYPHYQQTYAVLGPAHEQKGDFAKAIAEMEKSLRTRQGHGIEGLAQLGHVYATAGRTADARRVLGAIEGVVGEALRLRL